MLRQHELVRKIRKYNPAANAQLLNDAYVYGMKAHGTQMRASGEPYFSHPVAVADILTDLKLDDATIITALLHDTIEDTDATHDDIEEKFGKEIVELIDGVTKISKLDLFSKEAAQAENLRKFLIAIADDIRVLLVKLADRLHNMRTIRYVKPEKRKRIAEETMDIYAPLAGRMGMQEIREELEDMCFEALHPEARETILLRLNDLYLESEEVVKEIERDIKKKFRQEKIKATVTGRRKRPFSIWQKMERKNISLGQLSDILAFRVIVDTVEDCYHILGVIHQNWRVVPGRFKDFISNPKQNDYRSIHTTVVGPGRKRVELQIRTKRMHDIAEYGVAAHVLYKDEQKFGNSVKTTKSKSQKNGGQNWAHGQDTNAYQWLRRLVNMVSDGDNPREFLEHTRLELFHDQVFTFTPKGTLIALPRGATPIDFAYAVHTDVGDSCVGCKINGKHSPLSTELNNGDEVEIVRSQAQTPPSAWEGWAVTGKARAAIRRASRMAARDQYAGLGREILSHYISTNGLEMSDENLETVRQRLQRRTIEDMMAEIGRGELSSTEIIEALKHEKTEIITTRSRAARFFGLDRVFSLPKLKSDKSKRKAAPVPVRGMQGDVAVRFAPNCGAVPGDRIVGIMKKGKGLTIYPIFAEKLSKYDDEPERWVDLAWDVPADSQDRFPARFEITVINEVGALATITQVIGELGGNIDNLSIISRASDFYVLNIDLEVFNLKHLNEIKTALQDKMIVSKVRRLAG